MDLTFVPGAQGTGMKGFFGHGEPIPLSRAPAGSPQCLQVGWGAPTPAGCWRCRSDPLLLEATLDMGLASTPHLISWRRPLPTPALDPDWASVGAG